MRHSGATRNLKRIADQHLNRQATAMNWLDEVRQEPVTPGTVAEGRALGALRAAQRLRQGELEAAWEQAYRAQTRRAA